MNVPSNENRCKGCQQPLTGPYCAQCGMPRQLPKIDRKYIFGEIANVFNFQKGILFTIREMVLRPGKTVRCYLHEDRRGLIKPISFILLSSLIYILAKELLKFEDAYINISSDETKKESISVAVKWIRDNYGMANVFIAAFSAQWIRLFFRNYGYNSYEIIILMCYIIGVQMLTFSLGGILESLTQKSILEYTSLLGLIYVCWALASFFNRKKLLSFIKGFFCYVLGLSSFLILGFVVGVLVNYLTA